MAGVANCLCRSFVAESTLILNVLSFGAKPNGVTDSTQAFMDAWSAACASSDFSTIRVPKGRCLLPPAMVFKGGNYKSPGITLRIDGTLVASSDYRILGQADTWLSFETITGVSIIGGALNAKGTSLWACKLAGSTDCPSGSTSLSFTNSNNIRIDGLMSLNSQMFDIVINGCQDVPPIAPTLMASMFNGQEMLQSSTPPSKREMTASQLAPAPKTYGSSTYRVDQVTPLGCGNCSIGSLGKDLEEEGVQNVTVKDAIFKGGQNGLRIKSWARPSHGFVQGVQFLDVVMANVQNPIVIDQITTHTTSTALVLGVKVSEVSATEIAINLDCSAANPCGGITLENVSLTCKKQVAQSYCSNAIGKTSGLVHPTSCL
ncbi:hypothetical protein DVH24_004834 [Malus domestica]|uniref:Pectate lyase superfamily protein domain-containing protein n=1 Tax=Malus domestica TaxID=3750 RepID=A0A498ICG1_MALDO|nr:hypothetical protein DVH24_004834 [Malus domestica]